MPKRNPILKIEIKNNDVNLSCFDFPKIADLLTEIQKEGTDDQKRFNKIFLAIAAQILKSDLEEKNAFIKFLKSI